MNNSCLPPTTRLTINISCEHLKQQNEKIDYNNSEFISWNLLGKDFHLHPQPSGKSSHHVYMSYQFQRPIHFLINISINLITQEEFCGKNYKSVTICKADNKLKRGYLIQVMHDSRKYLYHPWGKKTFLTAPHYSTPEGRNLF